MHDFKCMNCEHEFEELITADGYDPQTGFVGSDEAFCPRCGSVEIKIQLSTPRLNTMNLLDKNTYANKMKERSANHTKKEVLREPERFGVRKLRGT